MKFHVLWLETRNINAVLRSSRTQSLTPTTAKANWFVTLSVWRTRTLVWFTQWFLLVLAQWSSMRPPNLPLLTGRNSRMYLFYINLKLRLFVFRSIHLLRWIKHAVISKFLMTWSAGFVKWPVMTRFLCSRTGLNLKRRCICFSSLVERRANMPDYWRSNHTWSQLTKAREM